MLSTGLYILNIFVYLMLTSSPSHSYSSNFDPWFILVDSSGGVHGDYVDVEKCVCSLYT